MSLCEMNPVLRKYSILLSLAALHWIVLETMAGLSIIGRMGGLQTDGSTPQFVAEREARKQFVNAGNRVFDCLFSTFSWPGSFVQPVGSIINNPERYDGTTIASIITSLFWGSVIYFTLLLNSRRINRLRQCRRDGQECNTRTPQI